MILYSERWVNKEEEKPMFDETALTTEAFNTGYKSGCEELIKRFELKDWHGPERILRYELIVMEKKG